MEIYQAMYKETIPPLNFGKAMRNGVTKNPDWFMDYYMPVKRQQEIIDVICKKYYLSKYERTRVETEVYLGSAPTSVKKEL